MSHHHHAQQSRLINLYKYYYVTNDLVQPPSRLRPEYDKLTPRGSVGSLVTQIGPGQTATTIKTIIYNLFNKLHLTYNPFSVSSQTDHLETMSSDSLGYSTDREYSSLSSSATLVGSDCTVSIDLDAGYAGDREGRTTVVSSSSHGRDSSPLYVRAPVAAPHPPPDYNSSDSELSMWLKEGQMADQWRGELHPLNQVDSEPPPRYDNNELACYNTSDRSAVLELWNDTRMYRRRVALKLSVSPGPIETGSDSEWTMSEEETDVRERRVKMRVQRRRSLRRRRRGKSLKRCKTQSTRRSPGPDRSVRASNTGTPLTSPSSPSRCDHPPALTAQGRTSTRPSPRQQSVANRLL